MALSTARDFMVKTREISRTFKIQGHPTSSFGKYLFGKEVD